jgi:hypothetical protein
MFSIVWFAGQTSDRSLPYSKAPRNVAVLVTPKFLAALHTDANANGFAYGGQYNKSNPLSA